MCAVFWSCDRIPTTEPNLAYGCLSNLGYANSTLRDVKI
ncbi:hypothetical protein AM1_5709 [Acaryochloris marina MBIC11017]|uniref:Uncharacterized protein n=1 Tax=Acaryochloris marina (strain MBIC 11017) TaxID=329726 RepID=B0CGA3_ACAM1|nr:hypothetical protein AM1_5709 [Acaryochloris marina MBIC11017]